MNADPAVMEFFPKLLSPDESKEAFNRYVQQIEGRGWGIWAVEIEGEFAGLTGLAEPRFEAHFTPCIEIGWRFHRRFWGKGYALESARIALRFAFRAPCTDGVVSFTSRLNERSQRLMQRLGMTRCPADDFAHPSLPEGHPLSWHVLYRMKSAPGIVERLDREISAAGSTANQ
jgi:RimJ/RimL family protein N-acetyltransferase